MHYLHRGDDHERQMGEEPRELSEVEELDMRG